MPSAADRITIYSDYVCPFCYLGRRALDAYLASREDELEIDWRPYDLRSRKRRSDGSIDESIDDGKDEAYFAQVRRNVDRLRREYAVEEMCDIDEVRGVDSLLAQLAAVSVQRAYPDHWLAFDEAIFAALWVEGRDVGDPAVLVDLAESVGVPGEEIRHAIDDPELRERLAEAFAAARRQGVTGVPTFVYGEYVARGAVPPEQLRRLIEATG